LVGRLDGPNRGVNFVEIEPETFGLWLETECGVEAIGAIGHMPFM